MKKITLIIFLLVTLLPSPASAASTRSLLEKVQENYKSGHFAEALESIGQAPKSSQDESYIFYDRGNILFRQGKYDEAVKNYEQAALHGDNPGLTSRAYYNMGNAALNQARSEQDGQKSLDLLHNSVHSYRNALRLDSSLADAAHNLELARLAIKQKKEELRQQKQQQQQQKQCDRQQNKDDTKKNLERMINRQEQQAEKNKENSQQQNNKERNQQMADEQQKLRQDTEKAMQQLKQQQQEKKDKAADELKQAMNSQQQAEDELKKNQPGRAAEKQEDAAKHLQQALDSLSSNDNKKEQEKQQTKSSGQQQQQAGQQQEDFSPAEQEEAGAGMELSPKDILELEKKLRQLRQQQMNRAHQGVEKDW